MRATRALAALAFCCLGSAAAVQAQRPLVRLGGGTALTSDIGLAGLLAFEGRFQNLVLRAEGRPIYMSESGQQGGQLGGAVGVAGPWTATFGRPYFLATLAQALDLREADSATALGVVVGSDFGQRRVGEFLEVRYEHLAQPNRIHYRLPPNQVTLLLGFRLGRP